MDMKIHKAVFIDIHIDSNNYSIVCDWVLALFNGNALNVNPASNTF